MKSALALCVCLWLPGTVEAQGAAASVTKVAITSLIGDVLSINTYRRQVGTSLEASQQELVPIAAPVFDHAALLAAERALAALLPSTSISTLATPKSGSDSDPSRLWVDGKVAPGNPLITALRQENFTHLLTITKHRAPARMQLRQLTVGSGFLLGLGFYIDNFLPTKNVETGETGRGFVAPYAYFKLTLLDLSSLANRGEQFITASTSRSAADNKEGMHPWGAMTPDEKVSTLQGLIETRIAAAVPELVR